MVKSTLTVYMFNVCVMQGPKVEVLRLWLLLMLDPKVAVNHRTLNRIKLKILYRLDFMDHQLCILIMCLLNVNIRPLKLLKFTAINPRPLRYPANTHDGACMKVFSVHIDAWLACRDSGHAWLYLYLFLPLFCP